MFAVITIALYRIVATLIGAKYKFVGRVGI
jgi:hypothetical protein